MQEDEVPLSPSPLSCGQVLIRIKGFVCEPHTFSCLGCQFLAVLPIIPHESFRWQLLVAQLITTPDLMRACVPIPLQVSGSILPALLRLVCHSGYGACSFHCTHTSSVSRKIKNRKHSKLHRPLSSIMKTALSFPSNRTVMINELLLWVNAQLP